MMLNSLPKKIKIVEVGPRDGLQNESTILSATSKATFIKLLSEAGLSFIEATSFVKSSMIPQMGDAEILMTELGKMNLENTNLICLVPNLKGLELALKLNVKEIAIFTATSDTFNKKNINATIDESLERLRLVAAAALQNGIRIRGYISTVFGCPYEGQTSIEKLLKVSNRLFDYGVHEISYGDTIGIANPLSVIKIIKELVKHFDLSQMAMHFHDTRGVALANVLAALDEGISIFDSSAGGLGGCPYARGATGNLATEDLVGLFHSMGIETGIDMDKLVNSSSFIMKELKKIAPSKYHHAYLASKK